MFNKKQINNSRFHARFPNYCVQYEAVITKSYKRYASFTSCSILTYYQ